MENQSNGNLFRDDEIVMLSHWDNHEEKWIKTAYPKIAGRLRLAHEDNEQFSISTEVIKYDGEIAVVKAITSTCKGTFPGIGMASIARDTTMAPAILELGETRAIARSLRFAGYGVEYCSAEELSHLENGNVNISDETESTKKPPNGDNGSHPSGTNGNSGRITNRQLNYIMTLAEKIGIDSEDLDMGSVKVFGVKTEYLNTKEASSYIRTLKRIPQKTY